MVGMKLAEALGAGIALATLSLGFSLLLVAVISPGAFTVLPSPVLNVIQQGYFRTILLTVLTCTVFSYFVFSRN